MPATELTPTEATHQIRSELVKFAEVSLPGARCITLWPDQVASVHILDNGGRLRDVTTWVHPEMIAALQERYPVLEVGRVIYLPPLSGGPCYSDEDMMRDLRDFFAGHNMLRLKESYP